MSTSARKPFRQTGDARGRRYSLATREMARSLYDNGAGWPVEQIVKILNKRNIPVRAETVRCWVDDEYRASRAKVTSETRRRREDRKGAFARRRMLELHDAGLSASAISVVMGLYHGRDISPGMARRFVETARAAA